MQEIDKHRARVTRHEIAETRRILKKERLAKAKAKKNA
jgi:hypothetical protein